MAMVSINDLWVMLLSTVRYSMGRSTYMSSLAGELVIKYSKYLTVKQLRQIVKEIDAELLFCEKNNTTLGMKMDDVEWRKNVIAIKNIVDGRKGEHDPL